jgi:putative ABC transport system permease protein
MRSALTALGVVVGVGSVITMVAVGSGAHVQVTEMIRTLGANLLAISPGALSSGGAQLAPGTRANLTEDDADAIRAEVSDIEVAAPVISRTAQVLAGNRNWSTTVAGVNTDYLVAREWRIAEGRTFSADEVESGLKVAIVGATIAEKLFDDALPPGSALRIGNVPFSVIGVLEKKGQNAIGRNQDDVVFIPLSTAQRRVLGGMEASRRALDFILLKVASPSAMPDAERDAKLLLRQRHRLRGDAPDDFSINNPTEVLNAREGATSTLRLLLAAVASTSLVVGGISIMNIMLVSVTERTREIGLRMAVGARRRDIRNQFLIEATTLALVGGVVGALLGGAAAAVIARYAQWPVLISPELILLAFGFAGGVGVSFGFYPALRASRLDPIVALRSE